MAQFGSEVTSMNAPSLAGASYTSQGVQDNSSALNTIATTGLISNVGIMAKDAYSGYTIAQAGNAEIDLIKEYTLRNTPESIFSPKSEEFISPAMEGFQKNIDKYKRALEQGAMSPDEFEVRSNNLLRQAVNRNPGMVQELSRHVQTVKELSGITDVLKTDKLIQKSAQEAQDSYIKDLHTRLKAEHIYFDATTPVSTMEQQLQKAEGDTRAFETFKRSKEYQSQITSDQAIKWVEQNGDATVRGGLTGFSKAVLALGTTTEGIPSNYSQIAAQVRLEATSQKDSFLQTIPVSIRQQPAVLQKIESFNKGIDDTVKVLEGLGSGADWKTAMDNHLQITKDAQDQRLRDSYDISAINLGIDMLKADPSMSTMNSDFRKSVRDIGTALSSGHFTAPVIDRNMPQRLNDNSLSRHIANSAVIGKEQGNYETLNKVLDSFNNKTNTITDPAVRNNFLHNNVVSLSKIDLTGADSTTSTRAMLMIKNYLDDSNYGLPRMFANMQEGNTVLDVLPNGHVVFTGDNAQEFNDKFGIRINTALSAYANVNNIPLSKDVAMKFNQEYLTKYIQSNKDIAPIEANVEKYSDADVANKIKIAKKAGASIEYISKLTRKTPEEINSILYPPDKNIYESVSGKEMIKLLIGKDTYEWLGNNVPKAISATDAILFKAWRDLVTEGLMTEHDYRTRVRKEMGIK